MPDIQAAIGLHQLRRATQLWRRRQHLASLYRERLADIPFVDLPALAPEGDAHGWHLFTIRLRQEMLSIDRAQFIQALQARGIVTSVHFIPVHLHSFYRDRLGYPAGAFPHAERAYSNIISLPFHTRLADEDVDYVAEQVREVGRRGH
jgi:dTDP-4-amino-4,6-dideoxygalactose transaminase